MNSAKILGCLEFVKKSILKEGGRMIVGTIEDNEDIFKSCYKDLLVYLIDYLQSNAVLTDSNETIEYHINLTVKNGLIAGYKYIKSLSDLENCLNSVKIEVLNNDFIKIS